MAQCSDRLQTLLSTQQGGKVHFIYRVTAGAILEEIATDMPCMAANTLPPFRGKGTFFPPTFGAGVCFRSHQSKSTFENEFAL